MAIENHNVVDININADEWKNYAIHKWQLSGKDEDLIENQYRIFFDQIIERIFDLLSIDISFELSVLLTNNHCMQELNKKFREKDVPTNVLSFPSDDDELDEEENGQFYLGDIAFGFEIIEKESQEFNVSFLHHFTHLVIHGALHLLGYDHDNAEDAEEMEAIEVKVLETFNINNPYE